MLNFYPRPPRGGRLHTVRYSLALFGYFYPRPPRGGRPRPTARAAARSHNFYPRPPRGGRLPREREQHHGRDISIHALREEGDSPAQIPPQTDRQFLSTPSARRATPASSMDTSHLSNFYPRPPRGGRQPLSSGRYTAREFLSTPSARRATTARQKATAHGLYFYPRPPRGGRLRPHPQG